MPRFEDRVLRIERISKGYAHTADGRKYKLKTILPVAPPSAPVRRSGLERFAVARREQAKRQREMKRLDPSYLFESDDEEEEDDDPVPRRVQRRGRATNFGAALRAAALQAAAEPNQPGLSDADAAAVRAAALAAVGL